MQYLMHYQTYAMCANYHQRGGDIGVSDLGISEEIMKNLGISEEKSQNLGISEEKIKDLGILLK